HPRPGTAPASPSALRRAPGRRRHAASHQVAIQAGLFQLATWALPDGADHLAADLLASRVAIHEHTLRRREYVDTETAPHGGDLVHADVDAETRPADAPDPGDHGTALVVVPEVDAEHTPRLGLDGGGSDEVAFLDQHARDLLLVSRPGHVDARLPRRGRVPHTGQHVGDGIGHHQNTTRSVIIPLTS